MTYDMYVGDTKQEQIRNMIDSQMSLGGVEVMMVVCVVLFIAMAVPWGEVFK